MFVEIEKQYIERPLSLPFVVCTVGQSPAVQAPICRPEGFPYHHFLLVEAGQGYFHAGGEKRTLAAGQGVFCRAGIPHAYSPEGEQFVTHWLTFLGAESVLDAYGIGDLFYFDAPDALISSVRALYQRCIGAGTALTRSAAGYAWLVDWIEACSGKAGTVEAEVRRYLEGHFAEPLTLDQIARAVHRNRYALCHYYKEATGCTIMEQLRQIRMEKAKWLLRYETVSVEEIGRSCGFGSASYFGKIFRSMTGRSPREYRNDYRKKDPGK